MRLTTEIGGTVLPDLIKQVQAGNEVLLTQDSKPVARLVPAAEKPAVHTCGLDIPSITGHRVLTPNISQRDIAEEMFDRR
jgi:antitoxin (DNA-binding transcriptional repressor) of toxin-antitoxin stability system